MAVPRPLGLLLLVVALFGCTWALVVPPWQAPDEDVHFAYTQTLVERGELPGKGPQQVSSEQRLSMDASNTDAVVFFNERAQPDFSAEAERRWRAESKGSLRTDGGAPNAASDYPVGYYALETIPYRLASSGDVLTRLYAMRLFSVLWLLATTTGAWLLAGELFGRNRLLQLVTAATIGLWPMLSFMSSSINPDGMLTALWTLSTWLGVSILRRGLSAPRAIGLCLTAGLALMTKATALALVPPVAFVFAVGLWRARRRVTRRNAGWAAVALAAFAIPVLTWVLVAHHSGRAPYGQAALVSQSAPAPTTAGKPAPPPRSAGARYFASYLWQFYLPKLGFMEDQRFVFPIISHYPAYEVWLASGWASFGWVNVWFPPWVYKLFFAIVLLVAAGAAVSARRGLRALRAAGGVAKRAPRTLAAFFAVTAGALLGGLHWTDFHMLVDGKAPFMQGRYLLPIGALLALVVALAVRALPPRLRVGGAAAVLGGLVVFQLACLGLVAARFYG